ncbi:MAG: DUF2207 domain-containing protein [Microbacteriaceae bacterium]|nr:DUF2207 domain-containing protein [Microbacteriaceae bacterium]
MPRRLPRPLAAVAALVLSLGVAAIAVPAASPAAAAPERPAGVDDFAFDSFDAQYYLGVDDSGLSTLRTVETLVAVFPAIDQNRGIVRYIPMSYGADPWDPKRVDTQVHVTSVTDENGDPVVYETFDDGYGFLGVSIDDDTYKHGRHTYVIEYTQRDVTRYFANTDDDEFYWDLNGTGWSQPFGSVSGTVHLDDGLASALNGQTSCYWGYEGDDEPCELNRSGDQFTVTQRDLAAHQNVTIAIGFAPGTFAPGTRVEEHPIVTVLPWILLGVLGLIAVAIVILRSAVWRHAPGRGIVVPQYEGPEVIGVMPAAAFLGQGGRALAAQFVQFAVSGLARLIEDPNAPEDRRYRLELLDLAQADGRDDDAAARKIFGKGAKRETVVLYRGDRKLGDRIASLLTMSRAVPKARGLLEKKTSPVTKLLRWPAFACFLGGWFVVFWAGAQNVASGILTAQLLAIIVGSLVLIGFGGVPERRTQLGSEVLEHLQGLRDYLALAEEDRLRVLQSPQGAQRSRVDPRDDAAVVRLYEKLLPWAIVWGVEREWNDVLGDRYERTQIAPTDSVRLSSGISGLGAFSTSIQTTSFSQTVSSSSSGSYSSSGGSSFSGGSSGGGFSGGGGGGGGGGGR